MTISMPRRAIHAAAPRSGGGLSAAAVERAALSGKNAFEAALTTVPTPTPIASVTASAPTTAWSATPTTGISVNESTRIVVSGLPPIRPA